MSVGWLVTGAHGQLGSDLVRALDGADVLALGHAELDVTNPDEVATVMVETRPKIVVNTAGYTAVDAAETAPDGALAVNAEGPGVLAAACEWVDAVLVHLSTDYVFDGDATDPYEVDAEPEPLTAYGRSKLAGEQAVRSALAEHYVVRTAWLYGTNGTNFVRTVARLEREQERLDVVDDQTGSPTWAPDLAKALVALARSGAPYGTYHCTNGGSTTWCGLARAVFEELGADPSRIRACSTDDVPRPAFRPAYSVLSDASWRAAGLPPMRGWREALAAAFAEQGDALRRP